MAADTHQEKGRRVEEDPLVDRASRARRWRRYLVPVVLAVCLHLGIGGAAIYLAGPFGSEEETEDETVDVSVVDDAEITTREPPATEEDDRLPELPEPPPEPSPEPKSEPEPEPEPPDPPDEKEEPPSDPPDEPETDESPPAEDEPSKKKTDESSEPAPMDPVHLEGLTEESVVEGGDGPTMKQGRGIEEGEVTDRYVDPDRLGDVETEEGAEGSGRGRGEGGTGEASSDCPDREPELEKKVEVASDKYPLVAKRRGIEGEVVGLLEVDKNGDVTGVEILEGLGHGLDELARETFRRWRYEPARENCRPVSAKTRAVYRFQLRR